MTNDGRWIYTWNAENRLIQMETTSEATSANHPYTKLKFVYDWQGKRIARTVWKGGTTGSPTFSSSRRWLYDGWNPIVEFSAPSEISTDPTSADLTRLNTYTWGLDLSGTLQGAGGVGGLLFLTINNQLPTINYAPSYDGNGNIVAWTKSTASAPTSRREYDAFGNTLVSEGAVPCSFGFSTKMQDVETRLYYYVYRYYDPVTGRWQSRDPSEEAGGMNLYGFIGNNGVGSIDFLGLKEKIITVISGPDAGDSGNTDSIVPEGGTRTPKTYGEVLGIKSGSGIPIAIGAGPLGPTTKELQDWLDLYLKDWETKNKKKCCYTFKGNSLQSSESDPMTADRAKKLISENNDKSDVLVLAAHGSRHAIQGTETGLYFYKGKVQNYFVSIPYPVADVVSKEIKELKVFSCYDAGLPAKAGGTLIVKTGQNIDARNAEPTLLSRFRSYVNQQCDACK